MKSVMKEYKRIMAHLKTAGMKPSPRRKQEDLDMAGYHLERKYRNISHKHGKSLRGHL